MRDINNLEVAAVSGGLDRSDASSLLGAHLCATLFTLNYDVAGFNLGKGVAMVGGMVVGAVAGRFVDHLVTDHVFPITDSITP